MYEYMNGLYRACEQTNDANVIPPSHTRLSIQPPTRRAIAEDSAAQLSIGRPAQDQPGTSLAYPNEWAGPSSRPLSLPSHCVRCKLACKKPPSSVDSSADGAGRGGGKARVERGDAKGSEYY